jgi:CheY-like chemotaxis protein
MEARMILVVDDVPEIVEWLSEAIRERGYYADFAIDAISAVYKMERIYYALAFVDINLAGGGNGNDLARRVRSLPEPFCLTPLIAMSGSNMVVDSELFCDVVQKPFLARDLWPLIDKYARPPIPDIHPMRHPTLRSDNEGTIS